jgi:hypothetical protein
LEKSVLVLSRGLNDEDKELLRKDFGIWVERHCSVAVKLEEAVEA